MTTTEVESPVESPVEMAGEKATAKVDLTASNGTAPKRRGRPPGSRNKSAKTPTKSPAKASSRRRVAPAAPKTPTKTTSSTVDITAHAVLIENGVVNVLLSDGTSFKIDGPVFDRR